MRKFCPNSPFCNLLDGETRDYLCQHATITHHAPKQIRTQIPDGQLEVVAKGALLKFTAFEDGSQESIDVLGPGEIVGEHLLLLGDFTTSNPHILDGAAFSDFQTMALNEVTICNYPIEIVRKLFDENRAFSKAILQTISQHVTRLQINAMKVRTLSGLEKVEFVYKILENFDIDMKTITQEDLALIVGVSRNTVVRALKKIHENKQ